MRVANVIEEARVGGPQIRNIQVAKFLKGKIDIILIFPKENSDSLKKLCKLNKIKYLSLHLTTIKRSFIGVLLYIFMFPYEVVLLANLLRKYNFDLVHASGGCWQSKAIFAAKLAQIKVVWELNDTKSPEIVRKVFFFISNLANGFIFASHRSKDYYRNLIPIKKKNFIIQSPVDTNLVNPRLNYSQEKLINKIVKQKKIIIGSIANINPTKDFGTLIDVAKILSFYSNKITFMIVGPIFKSQKNYFKHLMYKIKRLKIDNFFFLYSRNDIRSFLKSIDIYVCNSKNESSPLSVWEAMSMEKAIVSTDVGDVKKFIKHNINGFVVKVGEIDNFAKYLEKLIKSQKLRKKFGKKSRIIAKNKLDIKICGQLHLMAYKKIAGYNIKV